MIKVKDDQATDTLVSLEACSMGVRVVVERGEYSHILGLITDEGLVLWSGLSKSFGLPVDEDGRVKVIR